MASRDARSDCCAGLAAGRIRFGTGNDWLSCPRTAKGPAAPRTSGGRSQLSAQERRSRGWRRGRQGLPASAPNVPGGAHWTATRT